MIVQVDKVALRQIRKVLCRADIRFYGYPFLRKSVNHNRKEETLRMKLIHPVANCG